METIENLENNLYSKGDFSVIIRKYDQLFLVLNHSWCINFSKNFWIKPGDRIVNIQRWVIMNGKTIFWDYLSATHWMVENHEDFMQKWNEPYLRCIKFSFWSGKSIIVTTNSNLDETPQWMLNLNKLYFDLDDDNRKLFDQLLLWITTFESGHFLSHKNISGQIKKISKEELMKILNMTEQRDSQA